MATHSVLTVELDGADVAVEVVRHNQSAPELARRHRPWTPPGQRADGVAAADIAFLVRNKGWLRQRLAKLPTPVPFVGRQNPVARGSPPAPPLPRPARHRLGRAGAGRRSAAGSLRDRGQRPSGPPGGDFCAPRRAPISASGPATTPPPWT